ncbi:MAG: D-2-hydroxyacid dehydrogenase [Oscillospiraceae bacterium]|nr:D-2-hydroxyacid dehydrogenase [Oscillospiraceae bacterium]
MELILNCLPLSETMKAEFARAAAGQEQRFAPDGRGEDGAPLGPEDYAAATVILGNPPPALLAGCSRLRLLQTRTAGYEQYAAPGVLPEGAVVRSASGAYGHSVSEHMFAMLLSLMKRLPAYRDQQREGRWADLGCSKTLEGARVLVAGTGDLGSCFALLCKALGAETVGLRRDPSKPAPGIDRMHALSEIDALLPEADVVALMLPHSPETAGLMDARRLGLMKPDAILLNGGRGTTVDCTALAQVLAAGKLWGAGLDVTDPEPLPPEHPLWRESRALITPHSAGGDHLEDTMDRVARVALAHLKEYLASL